MKEETSLAEIIQEKDFLPILEANVQGFILSCNAFLEHKIDKINKRVIGFLNEESELLVSFLDDYEARNNRLFSYFSELVASVRNLISVCYLQRHILRRYFRYHLDDDVAQVAQFHLSSGESFEFLISSVKDLVREIIREARDELGIKLHDDAENRHNLPDPLPKSTLPHNVGQDTIGNLEQPIVEIATVYLQAARDVLSIGSVDGESPDTIRAFVIQNLPEARVRNLEAVVHGLQSKYDTYVKNTRIEQSDSTLLKLRGHISMALHLLEYSTGLVHFYERHENDVRSVEAKRRISRIVDKNKILRLIVNYGYRFARGYIERGQQYADKLLEEYSRIIKLELPMPEGIYLHARPVSLIVSIVQHHGTQVQMEIEGEKVDANSIIQVLMVSGNNSRTRTVTFYGDEKPLNDLRDLFAARLGEDGLDSLPGSLGYLKSA
ncbi:MAG: HPr family phosphocarrier protein [Planctomycetes bacterium]|nr:HPr family phosphocarrier protein [Planctomycetota bacterium]